jgi:L-malate glycosyltransferase
VSRALAIGIVCFPDLGGSGVVASELAVGLAHRGHRVHLFATERPSRFPGGCERFSFHPVTVPQAPPLSAAPYDLAVASSLAQASRAHALDLVHVHYAVPHAVSAYLARQILGPASPKVVTSLHGTDVTRLGSDPSLRPVVSFAVAQSDGVTVPSDFLRRDARERLGLPSAVPVDVLPNFVDTERFSPPTRRERGAFEPLFPDDRSGGPVLFHVSNFRAVKRVPDLVEVLALARREVPARLVLVGDGPELERTREVAGRLGVEDSVAFLGRRTDFEELLRHADAFLLASESESFGIAALEALSSGVPVLAYDVGGLPEVVTPEVGRLVPPLDIGALAANVVEVLATPGLRDALGQAARERALSYFRLAPALDRWEAYLRRVVAGGSR